MINYSVIKRRNPSQPEEPQKSYACTQYSDVMDIDQFAEHIASHGSVYKRADIMAILMMSVDCMRELLLKGTKIYLGDLGSFSVAVRSMGVDNPKDFNPATHIKQVRVNWQCGERFRNLTDVAEFNLVPTRDATRKVICALKNGDKTVDLTASTGSTDSDSGIGGDEEVL